MCYNSEKKRQPKDERLWDSPQNTTYSDLQDKTKVIVALRTTFDSY
jgi:hypothetical protein